MNGYARAVLWLALAVQASWAILNGLILDRSPGMDPLGVVILAAFTAFAALRRRPWGRWLAVVVRFLLGADFLLSVGDRFGLLGPAGAPGVSWGDFAHFTDYTRSVTSFLPGSLAATLAVLATIAELGLGAALLLGFRLRFTALASALLLGIYGTSMMISLPAAEQFHYAVFVLGAGMLTLATLAPPPVSLDATGAAHIPRGAAALSAREAPDRSPRPRRARRSPRPADLRSGD